MLLKLPVRRREVVAVDPVEMNKGITLGAQQGLPRRVCLDFRQGTRSLDKDNPRSQRRIAPSVQNPTFEFFHVDLKPMNFCAVDTFEHLVKSDRGDLRLRCFIAVTPGILGDPLRTGRLPGIGDHV
jgi:hypothetical protein